MIGVERKSEFAWDEQQLRQWYLVEQLSMTDIAQRMWCSVGTPRRWLHKWNIPIRTDEEGIRLAHKHGKFLNKQNPETCANWSGGRWVDQKGYVYIYKPDYHRTSRKKYIQDHILIW